MESFIAAPQVHVSALKNPAMIGVHFINYDANRAWEIEALLEKTQLKQKDLLDLDSAITKLDFLLKDLEAGSSDSKPIIESAKLVEFCQQHNIFSKVMFGKKEITLDKPIRSEIISNKNNSLELQNTLNNID